MGSKNYEPWSVSDSLPLRYRFVGDKREKICFKIPVAPTKKISVIITFHNEHWLTLWRAIYSLIDTAPKESILEAGLKFNYAGLTLAGGLSRDHRP